MKKKILSLLLAMCMAIPMTFSLVACDKSENDNGTEATKQSTMSSNNITLSYAETVYDGTEKQPAVTLKYADEIVTSDNYTVEYSNNVNAGTATVVVKSNSDSEILDDGLTFTTTFEIKEAPIFVSTVNELNAAILITDSNHIIKLAKNIEMQKDASNKVVPILIFPSEKDYDVKIDLAGYDLNSYFNIRSISTDLKTKTNNSANVTIINSTNEESVVGCSDNSIDYAIQVRANAEGQFNVKLENIKFQGYWGGFATNGSDVNEAKINAKNCQFIGLKATASSGYDASTGVYLAAGQYVYNFEDCEFSGFGGYYTKAGHHFLKNCTVMAIGEVAFPKSYNNNGGDITGSAIMIDSCASYSNIPAAGYQRALTVDISGGRFVSAANYALHEFSTYQKASDKKCYAFVHITDDAVFEGHVSLDTDIYFENECAYYSHVYSNDEDMICNECGVKREIATCNVWDGKTETLPEIKDGVISITTAEQLASVAAAVNSGNNFLGVTIRLEINIDLNNIEWTPIGYGVKATGKSFDGIFDGQGHIISNLKIKKFVGGSTNANASAGVGLFGYAGKSSIIKNVVINGARVDGNHYVGSLIGYALHTVVENCSVKNATINCIYHNADDSGDKAGALIGHAAYVKANTISATNSVVKASRDAGQVVGCIANTTTLKNASATNVNVLNNETGVGDDAGTNISNEVVGRDAASISLWNGSVGMLPEDVNKVITIRNASELAALAAAVNAGNTFDGYTIKLARDIDLDNIEWTPIGYGYSNFSEVIKFGASFRGTFDGQNKVIYNLKVTTFVGGAANNKAATGVGLFGHIVSAEIKNVKVTGAEVVGNHYVGVVVGFSLNSNIDKCVVKTASASCVFLDEDESGDKVGIIVGQFARTNNASAVASISNCSATSCSVDADRDAGKLIGCLDNVSTHTGNKASKVTVSYNESGKGVAEKTNTNISDAIVGRMD